MNRLASRIYQQDLRTTLAHCIGIDKLKNSSILITGATGTICSYLVDTLLAYNAEQKANITIYATSRNVSKLASCFTSQTQQLKFIEFDITKPLCFDVPVDYIIHAAGNAYPASFVADPVGTIMGNIIGTYHLLEYTRTHATKRFLYVSSGEVYGCATIPNATFSETFSGPVDSLSFRSCYPNSKRTTETLCASYIHQYGIDCVIARPCHTYGPGITPSDNRANAQFFTRALAQQDIVLKSVGSQVRSYCYVGDCVSALLTVLSQGKQGEAYNIANPQGIVSIANFAHAVAAAAYRKVVFELPTNMDKLNQSPIPQQVLDNHKLIDLGWKGSFSLEKGIQHTLAILQDWKSQTAEAK